jgi:hypothetical protein
MPATAARIAFVLAEFRSVVASDAAVKTKYGDQARDTREEPFETFFDNTADAQVIADARLTLVKADRRRFKQDARGVQTFTGPLDFSQTTPAVNVIDDERSANHNAASVELGLDLGGEKTTFLTWG